MDSDLTCDALDSDRDGDSYANDADVFPDDVSEWTDNDADGTGDNADTDDDDDGTLTFQMHSQWMSVQTQILMAMVHLTQ